ncbi:MAG: bifunctional adenosylcobinamide kinase/adenosylcobinamide-phosphate guanylyltransferase, partial [Polyangiaceae bacterium]|nr:bifunctional adenosylcobinamide kinase/adenosylcobinamide-phosphate guanylyltransferase [Polyangiaceae bacterium]
MEGRRRTMKRVVLVGGGVRSGKSDFALERALTEGGRCALIATAQAFDSEMKARIEAHRETRPAAFRTFEEPIALSAALAEASDADAVVIDCLTLWVSNLLMADHDDATIRSR